MARLHLLGLCAILSFAVLARAQDTPAGPAEDVQQITDEAQEPHEPPLTTIDRPVYRATQDFKKELSSKYGISLALEDTAIYLAISGGVDANDAMVNTLGLFATWKIFRDSNQKDFAGFGFQFETRGNHESQFTQLRDDIGTLWSPNDATSDDYTKINQLWWAQKFAEGRFGYQVGKTDPRSIINVNRFAGSGNTQYFGQPFATNPARSFSDNGLGFQLRAEPTDWLYAHYLWQTATRSVLTRRSQH